jgi:multidrug efflux pump subunit AcrA (membrane-fusion protein)
MIAAAAVAAWLLSREHQAPAEERSEAEKSSVVAIETVPIERKTISEKVIAYGSVIAQPGKTYTVSVAFESHINHVLVAAGQLVGLDDPLVEIEASPATDLLLRQAQNTLEIAQRELTQTQERFRLKLATNQELNQAQKTASDADIAIAHIPARGCGIERPASCEDSRGCRHRGRARRPNRRRGQCARRNRGVGRDRSETRYRG